MDAAIGKMASKIKMYGDSLIFSLNFEFIQSKNIKTMRAEKVLGTKM
jgi:hypothetical protein